LEEKRQKMRPFIAEIKSRGQVTIPKKIRVMSHLEEGQVVSIIPVGDSVIITPKKLELDEARREMKKILRASGVSLEDLLAGLKEEREKLYRETYGKKSR
jgi:AbrB family looped-hinge helix DNA binding protein